MSGGVPSRSVAVVVFPYLYATALERMLRARGFEVDAPDVMVEEWVPTKQYDVVLTTLPLDVEGGWFEVSLPDDYCHPVKVSAGGVAVELMLTSPDPIEDLLRVVDRLVQERPRAAAPALQSLGDIAGVGVVR